MEMATINGEPRSLRGTRVARKMRATGRIPGIIYGHGEAPEAVAVSLNDVESALLHHAHMVKLDIGGKSQQYLIKDVQYDYLGETPLHVDFFRVSMDERVRVLVGIELRGTPEGIHEGGTLDQLMAEIEVECLPADIPESLRPRVGHLKLGESLLVSDIESPAGVTLVPEPNERVAMVRAKTAAAEVEEAGEVSEQEAQPEVISRGKKEEEGAAEDKK